MRVILDIPEVNLERLGELAKFQKRSRKAFMEYVLITHAETAENGTPEDWIKNGIGGNQTKVTETPQISAQVITKDDLPKKEEKPKNELKQGNLTDKPVRLPNEDAIDYAGRVNEWKKSLKQ